MSIFVKKINVREMNRVKKVIATTIHEVWIEEEPIAAHLDKDYPIQK